MADGPLQFPVDEAARARLAARCPGARRGAGPADLTDPADVVRPDAFRASPLRRDAEARIRAEERRRAMPEALSLWVLYAVLGLTVAPVALLAFVGY